MEVEMPAARLKEAAVTGRQWLVMIDGGEALGSVVCAAVKKSTVVWALINWELQVVERCVFGN